MVTAMTPQGTALLSHLQKQHSDQFFDELIPLLDDFTDSTTDTNVQQSLPLIQPLLELLASEGDVPYQHVTRALSALLAPLPFEQLRAMGLYPVMQQGLHSSIPSIQLLALEQAQKMTEVDDMMASSLLDCLGAEDPGVGKKTVQVITTLFSRDPFQTQFLRLAQTPRTSLQIPRFLDLIVSLASLDAQLFQNMLPLLNSILATIKDTDVLMTMNVVQFYSHLLEASSDPSILAFLEPKIPQLMTTLAPDADAFASLLGAGTCEFVTTLRTHPEFKRLDKTYSILTLLEFHVLNPASPQHVPALMGFSRIASTDGLFEYIDPKLLSSYRKLCSSRPITPEKLTSIGIVLSNSHTQHESLLRQQWFTLSLSDLIVPFMHDPTMQLSPITLLSALSGHVWGVKVISSSAVTMEWLQDRQGGYQETTGKFAVVRRMLATTLAEEGRTGGRRDELNGPLGKWRAHVEIFVSRGEWWRDETAEVATEGG